MTFDDLFYDMHNAQVYIFSWQLGHLFIENTTYQTHNVNAWTISVKWKIRNRLRVVYNTLD
jgi:hypothetical protein